MKKLTFLEYYQSKEALLQASKSAPKIITEYIVKKYCKFPVQNIDSLIEAEKDYVSLKPNDSVKILWEFNSDKSVHVQRIIINETYYKPCWQNAKIKKWVETTLIEA